MRAVPGHLLPLPLLLPLLLLLPGLRPALAQAGPTHAMVEPRAFGYAVGDVLQRRVLLQLPPGWSLDPASLPQLRRAGQAIELRAARLQGAELQLDYQVFLAPTQVRTLELPPLLLRLAGPAGEQSLRIDAWPVTVAPLVPLAVSPRTGLGELRPDSPPPPIDTAARRLRLAMSGAALALLATWLVHVYFGLPWWRRKQRPFAQAWRRLRQLPADASARQQQRAALLLLHQALNASAGGTVFAGGLADFIAAQPRFAPLQPRLADFFHRSQAEFFAGRGADADLPALRALCRACRDAERGSA